MKRKTSPEKQLALKLARMLGDAKLDEKLAIKAFREAAKNLNTAILGSELRNVHYAEGVKFGIEYAADSLAEYFKRIEDNKKLA